MLDPVAARDPALGAHALDHDTPAAYRLPGRRVRIVLTRGTLELLTDQQLAAVLAHERAHVAGRHHLARTAADALAAAFPFLLLARLAAREAPLLLETAADDRAVRRHPRAVLAAAMHRVADGQVPRTAFAPATAPVLLLLLTCGPVLP